MLRSAAASETPYGILLLDFSTWDEVKDIVTNVIAEKSVPAKLDAILLLLDPLRKKQVPANKDFGGIPTHILTKPVTRTKLRALIAAIYQGKSTHRRTNSLGVPNQNIVHLPSGRSPPISPLPPSPSPEHPAGGTAPSDLALSTGGQPAPHPVQHQQELQGSAHKYVTHSVQYLF